MVLFILVLLVIFIFFCWRTAKKMMEDGNKNSERSFSDFSSQNKSLNEQVQSFERGNTNQLSESSVAQDFKTLNQLYKKGENTDKLEKLEIALHNKTFKVFLYEEVNLDAPIKILNLAGRFITDSYTLNFIKNTPFNECIFEEHGDRYDDVVVDLRNSKKLSQKTLEFREILENDSTLEDQKKELDKLFINSKKLLNDTLYLNEDDNWKKFKNNGLTVSDYLLATSFYNHGNSKAYELYLSNYKTQDDYRKLTVEDLISLNFRVKKTQEKIMAFRNFYINLSDVKDIWLFSSAYKDWKEKTPLKTLNNENLCGKDSL